MANIEYYDIQYAAERTNTLDFLILTDILVKSIFYNSTDCIRSLRNREYIRQLKFSQSCSLYYQYKWKSNLNFCSVFVCSASLRTQKPLQKFRISGVAELRS